MNSDTKNRPLSESQIDALLDTPDPSTPTGARNHAMLVLMADAALRVSELLALGVGDIVNDGRVPNAVIVRDPKKPQPAFASLTERASESLTRWLSLRETLAPGDCPLVFCTVSRGTATGFAVEGQELRPGGDVSDSYVRAMVRREGRKAGIAGCHPHQLRQAAILRALRVSGDLALTQQQARHGSKATTRRLLGYWSQHLGVMTDHLADVAGDQESARRDELASRIDDLDREHECLAARLRSLGEQLHELRAELDGRRLIPDAQPTPAPEEPDDEVV